MKRLWIAVIAIAMVLSSCGVEETKSEKLTVAVSIVPQATFVKAVAGELVDVVTLIPPGASPANYQPSPKELAAFGDASVYFTVGVGAEESNILPNIAANNEGLEIVDLAHHVDEVYPARYFEEDDHEDEGHDDHEEEDHDDHEDEDGDEHDHSGRDPHIWMSPKRVIVMVNEIRDSLVTIDPDNEKTYTEKAAAYVAELETLDIELGNTMAGHEGEAFIIMHPSLGYFADDYHLEMVAIEQDGKEASAAHLGKVIDYGRDHEIHVVLYQSEFDSSQAETIAEALEGEVLEYEPLAADYMDNMNRLGDAFKKIFPSH